MSRIFQDKIINGTGVRIREGDSPITLVMLHGIGSNKSSFDALAEFLPIHWNLIAWDAPGYDSSNNLDQQYPDPGDYANGLQSLFEDLNISNVILLGHSLGTLIATRFCRDYPDYVSAVILLACAQGHGQPKGQLSDLAQKRLDDLDRLGNRRFAQLRAGRLMHQPEKQTEVYNNIINAMASIKTYGYGQAVHMLAQGDLKSDAAQIEVSSLVLVGDEDIITPPEQSHNVHQALSSASPKLSHIYHQVSDTGHAVHQQNPSEVANQIIDFEKALGKCLTEVCS